VSEQIWEVRDIDTWTLLWRGGVINTPARVLVRLFSRKYYSRIVVLPTLGRDV